MTQQLCGQAMVPTWCKWSAIATSPMQPGNLATTGCPSLRVTGKPCQSMEPFDNCESGIVAFSFSYSDQPNHLNAAASGTLVAMTYICLTRPDRRVKSWAELLGIRCEALDQG